MRKIFLVFVLFLLKNTAFSQTEITPQEIYNHISFLASDEMKGRFPGTKECDSVANYIRNDFLKSGLKQLGDNGFQYFEIITKTELGKDNSLKINGKNYKVKQDFIPLTFSANGSFSGGAVIAGYGIVIDQDSISWDDYKGLDVKNKWVVIFRGYPKDAGIDEKILQKQSPERVKITTAKDKGALGVIFITPSEGFKTELIPFQTPRFYVRSEIPAISVSHKVAEDIFRHIKPSLEFYEKTINKRPLPWQEIQIKISATVEVNPVKVRTQNIVALLEGSDKRLKNRYIVIGAHCDHLGMGGYESGSKMPDTIAVHNGADDNASGTAGLLELAEYLASKKDSIKRSIIFIAFSAEERGLLGSQYFVEHPLVPLDSIDLMLNMDMIGQYNGSLSAMGTGSAKELPGIFKKIRYDTNQLKVNLLEKSYGGSDHASFTAAKIPAVFFYASAAKGYHTPFDDIENIKPDKEALLLKYIAKVAINAANYDGKLHFQDQAAEGNKSHNYGTGVTLGIMPAFEDTGGKGLKIAGVVSGKPAEKAGMKTGDIITEINGQKIKNIYDYMDILKTLKKGQTIQVKIIRKNEEKILTVVL